MTYEVGGEQYVAIEVGWGGAFGLAAGELARDAHIATNAPRVFAFKLGGKSRDAAARTAARGRLRNRLPTSRRRRPSRRARRSITGTAAPATATPP